MCTVKFQMYFRSQLLGAHSVIVKCSSVALYDVHVHDELNELMFLSYDDIVALPLYGRRPSELSAPRLQGVHGSPAVHDRKPSLAGP